MKELNLYHLSSSHHHSYEFFIVDVTVSVNISLSDHLINLLVSQLFSEVGHHVSQLSSWNQAVSVTIEYFEGFY